MIFRTLLILTILSTSFACSQPLIEIQKDENVKEVVTTYNKLNLTKYNQYIFDFAIESQIWREDINSMLTKTVPKATFMAMGSSTFTKWESFEKEFKDKNAFNQGFGGSNIRNVIHFSEQLMFVNQPSTVLLYVGDNDAGLISFEDFTKYIECFVDNFKVRLPNSKLILISVKPSLKRAQKAEYFIMVNILLKKFADKEPNINYVDIWTQLYKAKDVASYFQEDSLHFNDKGNALLTKKIREVL